MDATLTVGGVTNVKTAIQVKRWKNNVSGSTVRELRGGLMTDQRGLIITTAGFTKDAIAESDAPSKTPVSLINGERLVQLLIEKQIGVKRKQVPLLELNLPDLLTVEESDKSGEKSSVIWGLPGGKEHYFDTLLKFLDFIGPNKPTLDEMFDWVKANFEKVGKLRVVKDYLRNGLYSMGLVDFDGDRVVLTKEGEQLRAERSRELMVSLLTVNVTGIEEIVSFLKSGPQSMDAVWEQLRKTLGVSWETPHQTIRRLHWLQACGVVEQTEKGWGLVAVVS